MVVGNLRQESDVVVIGAGPGGYVAAIRAADLGREVILVEEREEPGGVCLLEGCIPSKTLIGAVEILDGAREAARMGITFSDVKVDPALLRQWTQKAVSELTRGVRGLLKSRGVELVKGQARFSGPRSLEIEGSELSGIDFRHAILATGSSINTLPAFYDKPAWSSAEALKLPEIPHSLLVIGGGYIGLEMGLIYAGLGSRVTMVEFHPSLLRGADPDLVEIMLKRCRSRLAAILTESKVVKVEKRGPEGAGFIVHIEHKGETRVEEFDQVLVAIGRHPNTKDIGLDKAGVRVDERGLVPVNEEGRSSVPHIFAIGDIVPGPALAHKASREGKVAAEVIAGRPGALDQRAVPAVVFTDPEIAWTGITETEAKEQGKDLEVARFPLTALGRARAMGRTEGLMKILFEKDTELVRGVGIVAPHASELIAEGTLAIEMGATLEDIASTIHPHPTLSEALMEAAEVGLGGAVHLAARRR